MENEEWSLQWNFWKEGKGKFTKDGRTYVEPQLWLRGEGDDIEYAVSLQTEPDKVDRIIVDKVHY